MRERFPRPGQKLSLWQKVCRFFGIGAEPTPEPKPAPRPTGARRTGEGEESGRRRSGGGEGRERSADRPARAKRPVEKVEVTSGRLYVGNLDYEVTGDDLKEIFQQVGPVVKAEIVMHSRSGRSKGFAFVEMDSIETAKAAVEKLHDFEHKDRKMLVCGAKSDGQREAGSDDDDSPRSEPRERRERSEGDRPARERRPREERGGGRGGRRRAEFDDEEREEPRQPKSPVAQATGSKLVIGNLAADATALDVIDGIEGVAEIVGAGAVEGGALTVEFASLDQAQRALEVLNGKNFMGQPLKVSPADDEAMTGKLPTRPAEPEMAPEEEAPVEAAADETTEAEPSVAAVESEVEADPAVPEVGIESGEAPAAEASEPESAEAESGEEKPAQPES